MKNDAHASARIGVVRTSVHGGVTVHTYMSPENGLLANTQIVEGPTRLVIFDGQYLLPHAREVAAYAKNLAKPVDRIILSHIHLDHWGGLSVISEYFPGVPVYAVAGVANYLSQNGQKILDRRKQALGDSIPDRPTIPTKVLREGKETIDGVTFEFMRFVDAESALQLVALMPDQQTLLAFDLAFAPTEHVFTTTPHFDNWIAILETLNAAPSYDRVLSGHGEPTDRSALGATIAYLRKGKEMYAVAANATDYACGMKATFPDRHHPGWIELSASLLYGVIDAYDAEVGSDAGAPASGASTLR